MLSRILVFRVVRLCGSVGASAKWRFGVRIVTMVRRLLKEVRLGSGLV